MCLIDTAIYLMIEAEIKVLFIIILQSADKCCTRKSQIMRLRNHLNLFTAGQEPVSDRRAAAGEPLKNRQPVKNF